ncbi:MAG: S8 family serine peptidase [Fimbriimonadaceae bacterium]
MKGLAALAIAALCGAAGAQISIGPVDLPDVPGGYPSDRIVVQFKEGVEPVNVPYFGPQTGIAEVDALSAKWEVLSIDPYSPSGYANKALADKLGLSRTYIIRVPKYTDVKVMEREYDRAPGVEYAEFVGIGAPALVPNDANIANCWGLNNTGQTGGTPDADIDAYEGWDTFTGYGNITLAVVDTGVDPNHPEMAGKMVSGWNTYLNNGNTFDVYGHGTHVAGTAGANGNNSVGLAGVSWRVKIMPMKVLSDSGNGSEDQCGAGMVWAADNGANIATMSLQYYTGAQSFQNSVNYAYGQGVLLIAATGNSQGRRVAYPAKFANCYAVGATNHTDARASFSNYGPEIDVVAPGENVYSCIPGNSYAYYSGTSMATPHTSGLASLIWSFDRGLTNDEVFDVIRDTAEDKGAGGWDEQYGWGRINARRALDRALLDIAFPTSIALDRGGYISGVLSDANNSDDMLYVIGGSGAPQISGPPIRAIVTGVSPRLLPSKLQFLIEAKANKTGISQKIELKNMLNGQWELVDTRGIGTSDALAVISITVNPARFIGNAGQVQARISYLDSAPGVTAPRVSLDQARWSVRE